MDLGLKNRTINTSYPKSYSKYFRRTQANGAVSSKCTRDRTDFNCSASLECHLLSQSTAQRNDLSFWSSGFNLTCEERTLEGFLKKPQAQQSNPGGFISLHCFLKQLKTLVVCLHWSRSLLESTVGFHMGFHSSPVLVQGRAGWKHQEAKVNTCIIQEVKFATSSPNRPGKASCPCRKKHQGHFRALHSSTAAGAAQHPQEWERFGSAAGVLYWGMTGSYYHQKITCKWLKGLCPWEPRRQVPYLLAKRRDTAWASSQQGQDWGGWRLVSTVTYGLPTVILTPLV